jgi:hypothetical protein
MDSEQISPEAPQNSESPSDSQMQSKIEVKLFLSSIPWIKEELCPDVDPISISPKALELALELLHTNENPAPMRSQPQKAAHYSTFKVIKSYPEPKSLVEARARSRAEAKKNSKLPSTEEKERRAEATYKKIVAGLLSGTAIIRNCSIQRDPSDNSEIP